MLKSTVGIGVMGVAAAANGALALTPRQSEGPFYPRPSHRFDDDDNDLVMLENQTRKAGGLILHLSGRVQSPSGEPQAGARVEIWQCDVNGRYIHPRDRGSNLKKDRYFQGFGHATAQAGGEYFFRTIRPVAYTGRTPHIHFKVFDADGREKLTTQMYVAGEPLNDSDGLYRRLNPEARQRVTVALSTDDAGNYIGRFDLVIGV